MAGQANDTKSGSIRSEISAVDTLAGSGKQPSSGGPPNPTVAYLPVNAVGYQANNTNINMEQPGSYSGQHQHQQPQHQQQQHSLGPPLQHGPSSSTPSSVSSSGISRSSSSTTSASINSTSSSSYLPPSSYNGVGPYSIPVGVRPFGSGPGNPNSTQHGSLAGSPSTMNYSFVPLPQASQTQKRPRRKFEEIERIYHCNYPHCTKAYGTLNHLNAHVTMQKHGERRAPDEFKETRRQWKLKKKYEMERYQRDRMMQQHQQATSTGVHLEPLADHQLNPYKYPLHPPPVSYMSYHPVYSSTGQAGNIYMPPSASPLPGPGYTINMLPSPYHHAGPHSSSMGGASSYAATMGAPHIPQSGHPQHYASYMAQNGQVGPQNPGAVANGSSGEPGQPYYGPGPGPGYDQFYKEQG